MTTPQTVAPALALSLALALAPSFAAQVDMHLVRSAAMDKNIPVTVMLPESYDGEGRYPVVYLLHGAGGSNWTNTWKGMQELVDRYSVILVSPDGAETSWWFDSPVDPKMRYETFAAKEVVAWTDATFRTIPDRAHRALTGGSMGGHGACYIGFRHKDVFGAVGNVYGGVNLMPFADKWGIDKRLGKQADHAASWVEHSVVTQAKSLRNGDLDIMSVVGTGDFFLEVNRELHGILTTNRIAHTYVEIRGEDDAESMHTWETFHRAEKMIFAFFHETFTRETVRLTNPTGEVDVNVGEGDRVEIDLDEPAGTTWKTENDELTTHVIVTRDAAKAKARVVIRPFCAGPAAVKLFKVRGNAATDGVRAVATIRIP